MLVLTRGSMVARRRPCCVVSRTFFFVWAFVAFITLMNVETEAVKVIAAQADALIKIRTDLNPLDPTILKSWNKINDCAKWLGVKCDSSGNVISLIVTTNAVFYPNGSLLASAITLDENTVTDDYGSFYDGILSDSLSDLEKLEILVFNGGSLHGRIPSAIGSLANLKTLNLANQILDGAIPESIGNLTQLVQLDLRENTNSDDNGLISALNGTLPSKLSKLVNLEYLDLYGCNFTGSPTVIKNFNKLVYLNLEGNHFNVSLSDILGDFVDLQYMYLRDISSQNSGEFPAIISNYTKLKVLSLANAGLSGSMPSSFGNLVNLEEINLAENQLTSIGSNFSSLQKLKTLNLAVNALNSIDYVTELTSVTHLEIQMNGLTGKLPDLSRLQSLEYLDANRNFFTGAMPDYVANFENLTHLNLDYNQFGGTLPVSLTNLKTLDLFSCAQCGLEGPFPTRISNMTALTYIDLHGNYLTGEIPKDIGKLVNLETLDLSFNQLTGTIPSTLNKTVINDLRLNNNGFVGNITNSLVINVGILWLNSNNFTGPIPSEIGSLASLSDILLQDNRLRNGIPQELWSLPTGDAINIDLSRNFLGGRFPNGISKLNASLASLRLSKCGLSGNLPVGLSKLENLEHLDLSENSFSGVLPSLENLTKLVDLSLNGNGLDVDVSSLPNSPLENLNLGSIGVQFGGLPELPQSYNKSLLTLSLQSNNINGNFNKTYFKRFEKLQAVFLQENQFSGNLSSLVIPINLEYLSLARNNLNAFNPGNQSSNLTLDLSDNPLCDGTVNEKTKVCGGSGNAVNNYKAPPVCNNTGCLKENQPNPYMYKMKSLCVCSGFLNFQISFSPSKLAYISKQAILDVTNFLNNGSGLDQSQVFVSAATISGVPAALGFTVQVFGTDVNAPGPQVRKYLTSLLASTYNSDVFGLGSLDYTRALATVDYFPIPPPPPSPPAPPSPPSTLYKTKKSGIEPWLIAVISVVAGVFLLTTILLALFMYYNYDRETMLEIKVGEGFVKGIPLAEVKTATDNFSDKNLLGVGGYGYVFKGIASNGEIWAVKRAKTISLKGLQEFEQEVSIISRMSHANIVKLLGFCDRRNEQILVYEFMKMGSLKGLLRPDESDGSKQPLSFEQRLDIAIGAAEGLLYLHKFARPPVIHRDIKSDNILLDENYVAKIADFGLLKDNPTGSTEDAMNTRVAGTPGYIDPEYFTNFQVTAKSDVYSFGVVLFELITSRSSLIKEETVTDPDIPNVTTLVSWVQPYLNNIAPIVDPRMGGYHEGSMELLVKIASVCTERAARYRPGMDEVARRLSQAKNLLKGIEEAEGSSLDDSDGGRSYSANSMKYLISATSKSNLAPLSESYGGR